MYQVSSKVKERLLQINVTPSKDIGYIGYRHLISIINIILVELIRACHYIITGKHMLYGLCMNHLLCRNSLYIGIFLQTRRMYFG